MNITERNWAQKTQKMCKNIRSFKGSNIAQLSAPERAQLLHTIPSCAPAQLRSVALILLSVKTFI